MRLLDALRQAPTKPSAKRSNVKTNVTQTRLRNYFEKHAKSIAVSAIVQHFHDVKAITLNYHLQSLLKEGFLNKPGRGVYQKNPQYQSPEDKRKVVEQHIATNGSRIQRGQPWQPGSEALTEAVNPVMFSFIARSFGESIVERMKIASFTNADVRFIESLLSTVYPISGSQKAQCERAWAEPVVPSLVSADGRVSN